MPLQCQLDAFSSALSARMSLARQAQMASGLAALQKMAAAHPALGVGATAPEFTLPDANGHAISLATLRAKGPVVLNFFRGGWCPFCTLELRAWQAMLPRLTAANAAIAAITPQPATRLALIATANDLTYPLLSDKALAVAASFGLVHTIPPDLIDIYRLFGHDLPAMNADPTWRLPIPATYVIDQNGKITFAATNPNPSQRADPGVVMGVLG